MVLRRLMIVLALGGPMTAAAGLRAEVAVAQATPEQVTSLAESLMTDQIIAVIREEGVAGAAGMASEFGLPEGDASWRAAVERIYDPARMRAEFDAAFATALADAPEAVTLADAFFRSETGKRALVFEIEARRSLIDPEVETAATFAWDDLRKEGNPRVEMVERFVEVNGLIESNVMGTLNQNLSFFRGMAAAGGEMAQMPESDLLSMVWEGEADARQGAADWLFPFLALAYQPLTDAELQDYTDFSARPEGQRVNAAISSAFDTVFMRVSFEMGLELGHRLEGQDI